MPAAVIGTPDAQNTHPRTQQQTDPTVETQNVQDGKQKQDSYYGPSGQKDVRPFKSLELDGGIYPAMHGINGRHSRVLKTIKRFQYSGDDHKKKTAAEPDGYLTSHIFPMAPCKYPEGPDQSGKGANGIH